MSTSHKLLLLSILLLALSILAPALRGAGQDRPPPTTNVAAASIAQPAAVELLTVSDAARDSPSETRACTSTNAARCEATPAETAGR